MKIEGVAIKPKRRVDPEVSTAGFTLCSACGFCCNSVLFSEVKFQSGDAVKTLMAKGIKKIRQINGFTQPCPAFDGKMCRVYALRPRHCRDFVCRLLEGVQSGAITMKAALGKVRLASRQAETVRELMRKLGQTDETSALSCRLGEIMERPYDPMDSVQYNRERRRLMFQSQKLMQILDRYFL